MMGNDIERMLSGIDRVKEASAGSVDSLADAVAYQLTTPEHTTELPVPVSSSTFTVPITSAMSGMKDDCSKMGSLQGGLYVNSESFNNGYGSPWTELKRLQGAVKSVERFASSHPVLNYVGEKAGLLGLINKVMSSAVDARWALMHFHDYVQRGFDHEFNGDKPSIVFEDGRGKESVGNIDHQYTDNVRIPPKPVEVF